jgi:small conductance mechanosensitive channel
MPVGTLVVDLAVRYGFQVLGALVIIAAGVLAARWLGRLLDRALERQTMEPPMRALMVRAVKAVVLAFTALLALDKFGFQVAPLVAGIGVAGLGVGFALQGVLGNLIAGLTIIFTKPFRVGEYVEVAGKHGDVTKIELFSTTLTHPDRSRVIIPNRKIVGEIVHNHGAMRQLQLTAVVPGDDLTSALQVAHEVVGANPRVLRDPAPAIGIVGLEGANVKLGLRPWVRVADASTADGELYQALIERFRARGIAVPQPARHEVRLLDGPAALAGRPR